MLYDKNTLLFVIVKFDVSREVFNIFQYLHLLLINLHFQLQFEVHYPVNEVGLYVKLPASYKYILLTWFQLEMNQLVECSFILCF